MTANLPDKLDPVADARSWPRWYARASILLPIAALLVMFAAQQLQRKKSPELAERIDFYASMVSIGLVAASPLLGVAGLIGGLRRRSRDTMIIAGLGLFLGSVLLLVTIWANIFVAQATSGSP